jgi:hypothetical protein
MLLRGFHPMNLIAPISDADIVDEICALKWDSLPKDSLTSVAWAYYFFSIQFRENLLLARSLYPTDAKLADLEREECNTTNLSPWPQIAADGERVDHDEFMRRALSLTAIDQRRQRNLRDYGHTYLRSIHRLPKRLRALSIASYEGGGLERVFRAMLSAPEWDGPLLGAFRHFLSRHLELDGEHCTLVDHIGGRAGTAPLWQAFLDLLIRCVPALNSPTADVAAVIQQSLCAKMTQDTRIGELEVGIPALGIA